MSVTLLGVRSGNGLIWLEILDSIFEHLREEGLYLLVVTN